MDLFKTLKILIFIFGFLFCGFSFKLYAADEKNNSNLQELKKQIMEKSAQGLDTHFSQLKDLYFKDNKYAQFVDFLKSLDAKNKILEPFRDYYLALSRYQQLKYLEQTQGWDEYFANGNTYRDEIAAFANKTINETSVSNPLHLYSQLILWQFHKDQEDTLADQALSDLMKSSLEYSKEAVDLTPIKKAADTLLAYGQKAKAKELYKIYTDSLVTPNTKPGDLFNIASGFYKEGNLELAETVYDIYIDRLLKNQPASKERLVSDLIDIARKFVYKDQGQKDPLYAEKIFKKIEEIGGKDVFDAELIYLRGFNLEKMKDYLHALEIYLDLIKLYPESSHAPEATFKIGIIQTYVLRDIEKGRVYFEKLTQQKGATSPWIISALYQLGLISQWQGDFAKARDYYNQLIGKLGSNPSNIRTLAEDRLKEIEEQKPIEYNLKTFLDVSLKEGNPPFNFGQPDLKSSLYNPAQSQALNISASAYLGESGCMQPQLMYLWSGDLGDARPGTEETNFSTKYLHAGTKVINLVVVSPAGIVGRTLDMLDVD